MTRFERYSRDSEEIKILDEFTKEDIVELYRSYFVPSAKGMKRLSVHIYGIEHEAGFEKNEAEKILGMVLIRDIDDFKKTLGVYPRFVVEN